MADSPIQKAQKLLARLAVRAMAVEHPEMGIPLYHGHCTPGEMDWTVTYDGKPLPPRNDLYNHSPDGFAWGYNGSGPAQCALAMLAHYYRLRGMQKKLADQLAVKYHQTFKAMVVAQFDKDKDWWLTLADMDEAVQAVQRGDE